MNLLHNYIKASMGESNLKDDFNERLHLTRALSMIAGDRKLTDPNYNNGISPEEAIEAVFLAASRSGSNYAQRKILEALYDQISRGNRIVLAASRDQNGNQLGTFVRDQHGFVSTSHLVLFYPSKKFGGSKDRFLDAIGVPFENVRGFHEEEGVFTFSVPDRQRFNPEVSIFGYST